MSRMMQRLSSLSSTTRTSALIAALLDGPRGARTGAPGRAYRRGVADFAALIGRFRASRRPAEVDVVIGRCSLVARPEIDPRAVTRIAVEQLHTLDVRPFIQALPRQEPGARSPWPPLVICRPAR